MAKRATKRHPTHDWAQLEMQLTWEDQRQYEIIRPVVLFGLSAEERALELDVSPRRIFRQLDRFQRGGIGALVTAPSPPPVNRLPPEIRVFIRELKAQHPPLRPHEISTICFVRFGRRPDHKTITRILKEDPPPPVTTRWLPRFHDTPNAAKRRAHIIRLHCDGWNKSSIAAYLGTSRPTVHATIRRFVQEGLPGLYSKPPGPKRRIRKVTLTMMLHARRHMHGNPRLGAFRLHAALRQQGMQISPRTCSRILAVHRKLYAAELPQPEPREPRPMPYATETPHRYWTIDIRYLDMHRLGGGMIYCISILDNASRVILASTLSRKQDLPSVLIVLYAAFCTYGCPQAIVSDSGSVFKAKKVQAIYAALGIEREHIDLRQPWQSYIETAFGVQRRMADASFERATTWQELLEAHEQWCTNYNLQSHWAHRHRADGLRTPAEVLGQALGIVYAEADLHRLFHSTRLRRRIDRSGYIRLRYWRIYADLALPREEAAVWIYEKHLTLVYDHQPVAHHRVIYESGRKQFSAVTDPQIIEIHVPARQLQLWNLTDEEWRKAIRIHQPLPLPQRRPIPEGVSENIVQPLLPFTDVA